MGSAGEGLPWLRLSPNRRHSALMTGFGPPWRPRMRKSGVGHVRAPLRAIRCCGGLWLVWVSGELAPLRKRAPLDASRPPRHMALPEPETATLDSLSLTLDRGRHLVPSSISGRSFDPEEFTPKGVESFT